MIDITMTDVCATPSLMPLEQAMEQLLGLISPIVEAETISLDQALNRILAETIRSPINIPLHDNSAMDGYALVLDGESLAVGCELSVVAKVLAGHPIEHAIQVGQCARIMTGGDIPHGCNAVIMQEQVEIISPDRIRILADVKRGQNIRPTGEDIAQDETVFSVGRRLNPADIGVLASMGLQAVNVMRALNVALISTGDELIAPGTILKSGQLYESNTPTLSAVLHRLGVKVKNYGIVADDEAQLTQVFNEADEWADVVITSGGVSVGEADFTKIVLERLGELQFWKLAIKPGKPFAFGQLKSSYFIGLPGNPVSALVTLHQLALPMLRKLAGETLKDKTRFSAIASQDIRKAPGRMDFQRGVYGVNSQGQLHVQTTGAQGSGLLTSMSQANCYIVLEQDRGSVKAGEMVTIELFYGVLKI